MAGYWQRPAETAEVMVDGMLRVGDIGYRDEDGNYFIVDRIKDLILCDGYNVYPGVIKEAVYRHQAVTEAVVIGMPDAYRGQAPKALSVCGRVSASVPNSSKSFSKSRFPASKCPKSSKSAITLPKP